MKPNNIVKKITSTSISLGLVVCLIFSSLSAYTAEIFFSNDSNKNEVSTFQSKKMSLHHNDVAKSDFLGEIIDLEEEEDEILHKKKVIFLNTVLRTLWSYSFIEADNQSVIDYADVPVVKSSEPFYIEYCSLKIPS